MRAAATSGVDGADAKTTIPRMNIGAKGLRDGGAEDGEMTMRMTGWMSTVGTRGLGGADIAPAPLPVSVTRIGDVRRDGDIPRQETETREMRAPTAAERIAGNIDTMMTGNASIVVSDGRNQVTHVRLYPLVLQHFWIAKLLRYALKVRHQSFHRKCLSVTGRFLQIQRRFYPRHPRLHPTATSWMLAERPKASIRR